MTDIQQKIGGEGLPAGFLDLAQQIYQHDPQWIPEEPEALLRDFGAENPWFADNQAISLCIKNQARLAGYFSPGHIIEGRPVAYFGTWETDGDADANQRLFQHVENWARAQGAKDLYGPIHFSTYGDYRLRVSAEKNALTYPAEPYNPPSYAKMLKSLGCKVHLKYITQLGYTRQGRLLYPIKRRARDKLVRQGYRFEALTHELWLDSLAEMHKLIDSIFGRNFGYTPLSWESFKNALGPSYIAKYCPITSTIAYGPDGDVAGFVLMVPNYGPLVIQQAGPERVSVSQLNYDRHWPMLEERDFKIMLVKTIGVSQQHRGKRLMDGLMVRAYEHALGRYDRIYGVLISDGNLSARIGKLVRVPVRKYALYKKTI